MTRTETDLRAMYADLADVDPSADLMSRLDGMLVKRTVPPSTPAGVDGPAAQW